MAHTRYCILVLLLQIFRRKVTIAHYPKLFETSAHSLIEHQIKVVSNWHGLHINIPLEACFIFFVQWYGCSQAVTAFCHIYDNHQLS